MFGRVYSKLPGLKSKPKLVKQPCNNLRKKFPVAMFTGSPTLTELGFDLLSRLLTYDPAKRITAEEALNHGWFREYPLPAEHNDGYVEAMALRVMTPAIYTKLPDKDFCSWELMMLTGLDAPMVLEFNFSIGAAESESGSGANAWKRWQISMNPDNLREHSLVAALNPCFNVSGVDYLIENISRDLEFEDDCFLQRVIEDLVHESFQGLQPKDFASYDVLGFWKSKENQFPVLSRMAMDILSVQASSVASESAFSTSGNNVGLYDDPDGAEDDQREGGEVKRATSCAVSLFCIAKPIRLNTTFVDLGVITLLFITRWTLGEAARASSGTIYHFVQNIKTKENDIDSGF
ncbi:cyclin-dependent kinase G-2-like protein [Tanacetum coccineum]